MDAKAAIRATADLSTMVLKMYFEDFDDADLMKRPGPGCNHLAWQLGHLITSECGLLNAVHPDAAPQLPAGFAEKHSKDTVGVDDPSQFATKQEYLDLLDTVRAATFAAIERIDDSELDQPAPEHLRNRFPTTGHIYLLIATHQMMHAGQFVPVRRALGKPIVI